MDDIEEFRKRLIETQAWYAAHINTVHPEIKLRSPLLRPSATRGNERMTYIDWGSLPERKEMVTALARQRAELLAYTRQKYALPLAISLEGRLLAFDPDSTLSDGAAWVASKGFFDRDNVPAWDTWIAYVGNTQSTGDQFFSSFLIGWVPHELADVVEYAIWANPEKCILWASDVDAPFIHQLQAAELLV